MFVTGCNNMKWFGIMSVVYIYNDANYADGLVLSGLFFFFL